MTAVVVIGGGPAGLMAADELAAAGMGVDLYESMPSVGRKFLMAGKGGLNLTHVEPMDAFLVRYGRARDVLAPMIARFGPTEIRAWVHGLGIETFVGSSQRVFPAEMKAAPLLRAWVRRLRALGTRFHPRHRWCGWCDGGLRFETPLGEKVIDADAVVLALGGGSWPKLGSDAAWVENFTEAGIPVSPLVPSNCGFDVAWSEHFRTRFAGTPVKPVTVTFHDMQQRQGEFVVTATGVEGGIIYALSSAAREEIAAYGKAVIELDLRPDRSMLDLARDLARPRGKHSVANYLRKYARLEGVKAGLLRELASGALDQAPEKLAAVIKKLPLPLVAPRPLAEAISTAGGVKFSALDKNLMLAARPGTFCAGEMLDWDAPTGGYLLTASLATGRAAGQGALNWVRRRGS